MCIRSSGLAFIALVLLLTGCASNIEVEISPTSPSLVVRATPSVTLAPAPSRAAAASPSPAPPTPAPVDGATSTQVNVRAEPSSAGKVLGVIPANTRVEITGRDAGGSWWQIVYPHPQAVDGKGWVAAQYVVSAAASQVPVVGGAQDGPAAESTAIVQQQLNVRSGPGTGFNSLGTLNPGDVVTLTGKDPNGAWLQIEFTAGPQGKGWVNAAFVRAQGAENLPIVAESGQVVGTGTPTLVPATATPTIVPAREDGDSAASPIASIRFEAAGTRAFQYRGDLSSPGGDAEDWITFTPFERVVFVSLECAGSRALTAEIVEGGAAAGVQIECGAQRQPVEVKADSTFLVHLEALPSSEALQYTSYILSIQTRP